MSNMDTKSIVPEGTSGDWRVDKFEVTKDQLRLFNMRCALNPGQGDRFMKPGRYTRLTRNNATIMSDTRAELQDHAHFLCMAKGRVLVNGLGLGMCLQMLLDKEEVEHVTVVERSRDVIRLVWPSFMRRHDRCTLVHADAFDYQPPKGVRYGAVWHDIWDDICADNLPDMHKLHRKYGRRTDWQGSWCRELCEGG